MTNIYKPGIKSTLQNYGQTPSDRIAYGGSIFSSSLNSVKNKDTPPAPLPQYPYGESGIWIPILPPSPLGGLLDGGMFGGNPPPPPLLPPPQIPEDTIGFTVRIYDFDPILVSNPANLGTEAFVPKNMILEFSNESICTRSDPVNSIIPGITYKQHKDWVKEVWYPSIKAKLEIFPQFQNDPVNDPKGFAQDNNIINFILANKLHPRFAYLTRDSFLLNDLKYTYCQYDPNNNMSLVNCGLCEPHEATYMQTYGARAPLEDGTPSLAFYKYTFYPNALFRDENIPLFDKCLTWKVECATKSEIEDLVFIPICSDVEPRIFPVQQDVDAILDSLDDDNKTKYFKDRENAINFIDKLVNKNTEYKVYYDEICYECLKINKYCYDQNIQEDPEYYGDDKFFDTMEQCENASVWIVTCEWKDGKQILDIVEIKVKELKKLSTDKSLPLDKQDPRFKEKCLSIGVSLFGGVSPFWTEEEALAYKNDPNNTRYYAKEEEDGLNCLPVHSVCDCHDKKPDYPQVTFETLEACEDFLVPDSGSDGDVYQLGNKKNLSYIFDKNSQQWIKIK